MRRLGNNKKGLSVIFGVLILIAIAVIAGIIIYMYTSGYLATMLGGGTTGQEKVAIQSITVLDGALGTVDVYAKSTGGGTVEITDAILKTGAGASVEVNTLGTAVQLPGAGTMTKVSVDFTAALTSGETYTITLVSKAGNQFVSASFKAP